MNISQVTSGTANRLKRALLPVFLLLVLSGCGRPAQSTVQTPTAAPITTVVMPTVDPGPAQPGGSLIFGLTSGAPVHFNPALRSGSTMAVLGSQLFASPLRFDDQWNPQPYLAKSWQLSDDGLTFTLHLVEGAVFHDGQPITSADVAFSVMAVKTHHPFQTMLAPVESVSTPDPLTAVLHLSRPHPAILLAMSPFLLPILPEHIYGDGQDLAAHPANLQPVGSGPFRFVSFTPGETIIMERFEDFFIDGRPYLDQLVFVIENDPDAQVMKLESGEVDMMANLSNTYVLGRLGQNDRLEIFSGSSAVGAINWLAFNHLSPPLADLRVRQAIAYAIDREFITQYLHRGKSRSATGPLVAASPYYRADVVQYDLDLEKARQMLDEAGYLPAEDGSRLTLTLDYIPLMNEQQQAVAHYIKRQLQRINVNVILRPSATLAEWAGRVSSWDYDLTLDIVYNWGDPVIGVHRTYTSDNIRQGVIWSNTQNYRNVQVDELLSQAQIELDQGRRSALYGEFQAVVAEDLPVYWLNEVPLATAYDEELQNPPTSIWGAHAPFDKMFWRAPENHAVAKGPIHAEAPGADLRSVGLAAIELLQTYERYQLRPYFDDPANGFLDMEGSGLHLLGVSTNGTVFLDNSGQTLPGMDITDVLTMEETPFSILFPGAEVGTRQGYIFSQGVWPNPKTQRVDPMNGWCGWLDDHNVLCALDWQTAGGER